MAKHIPGPFVVESVNSDYPHDICLGYDIPGEGRPILIAAVFHDEDDDSPISAVQASATARFFAASDDLEEGMARFILLAHSGMIGGVPPDIREWARSVLKGKDYETRIAFEVARTAIAKIEGKEPPNV
jgi:hypothetical protein